MTLSRNRFRLYGIIVAILTYGAVISSIYINGLVSLETLHPKYAFLFPIGIVVATIALSSGISGSNFWVPINVIVLNFEPRTGFWLALCTMLFGFGSGVVKHCEQRTINPWLVCRYLMMAIPGAIVGTIIVPYFNTSLLLIGFGVFVGLYGTRLLLARNAILSNDEKITLTIAFIGGMLKGMIATGLGKLLLPRLINRKGVSHPEAVGTVVVIVFITNIVAVLSILCNEDFLASLKHDWQQLFSIMVFVAPAVIIGGQIGPRFPTLISKEVLIKYVGSLLLGISYFMIMRGFAIL